MNIITGAVSQGLIWAIMVMGVYISYRILDFADLTADGSIALGGSVAAVLISNGLNPFVALILSFLAGVLSGSVTGLLNAKFGIPGILAGILTMISLYSVNIEILGRANISLLGANTCFSIANDIFGVSYNVSAIILSVVISLFIVVALRWFLMTEIGQLVRATGDNESMVRAMGKNPRKYKILSLAISNGLIALSGGSGICRCCNGHRFNYYRACFNYNRRGNFRKKEQLCL